MTARQPIPFKRAEPKPAAAEHIVPCAPEAEEAVIGSVLLDQDALLSVRPFLTADMFHDERHAWIYAAMLAAADRREPPDFLHVVDELRKRNQLDELGGSAYLTRLINLTVSSFYAEHYARLVERAARRRALITAAGQIATLAYDEGPDVDSQMDRAEVILFGVTQRVSKSDLRPLSVGVERVFQRIDTGLDNRAAVLGIPTGLRALDVLIGGLMEDEYIVVAAPPSMGKSAFIGKIAKHVAGLGKTVAVFSLEMGIQQWAQRYLASETGIDQHRIRLVNLGDSEMDRLSHAGGPLSALPLYIDDTPDLTPNELRAKARRLHARQPIGLIIVDYAQLMTDPSRAENRTLELEAISRSLKSLARELHVPLLVASQVTRTVTSRDNKRAQLSDSLGSGAFERDADMWLTLHRESYYQELDTPPDFEVAEIIVRKNRNGPTGRVTVGWQRKTVQFVDLIREGAPL